MKCTVCGTDTIGWIVTVQGGTRQRSIAGLRSKGVKCEPCAERRIAELRADEVRRTGRAR